MRANVAEVDQSLAVGDRNAKRVLRTRAFWAGLARLGEEFGIAGDGLVSFMSGSVAARLEDEAFFAGLARLGKEFGIAGDGLVSFMSDGVAARLEDDAFWAGLARHLVVCACGQLSRRAGSRLPDKPSQSFLWGPGSDSSCP